MPVDADAPEPAKAVGAQRFFWTWLIMATGVSVAGNITHAVLSAPSGRVPLAAAAAVVPPAVVLGSTHSVALLVRARRGGVPYWCALIMTLALAGCAFVLSFDALRDVAVAVGMPPDRAWLWPVAIDASIANSTVALLSLAPPQNLGTVERRRAHPRQPRSRAAHTAATTVATKPARTPVPTLTAEAAQPDPAVLARWKSVAKQLIRSGVTSKDPEVVAAVLAERSAGTSPSTIGRRLAIHHETVGRILAGADALAG